MRELRMHRVPARDVVTDAVEVEQAPAPRRWVPAAVAGAVLAVIDVVGLVVFVVVTS